MKEGSCSDSSPDWTWAQDMCPGKSQGLDMVLAGESQAN